MPRPFHHACSSLLLAFAATSCVFAVDTKRADAKPPADGPKAVAAKADTPADAEKKQADKAARKQQMKEREVTYARMELAMAEMDAANDLAEAKFELEHAKAEHQAAVRALEHFQKVAKPIELEDSAMDLDRTRESAIEQKQELDELTAMYKADDFAKLTKELVLQRGKHRMEMAQRDLALTEKRVADKRDHGLVEKERELTLALRKAEQDLRGAEAKLAKTQAHNELELMRARHKLEDASRPDEDDEGEDGPKGA